MKKHRSKNPNNHWVCYTNVVFDDSRKQWRWEIYHNDLQSEPRNLMMQGFCDSEASAIETCSSHAELHVEKVFQNDEQHIHDWFELTYASYLVLPRSLLQAMPGPWQLRFIEVMTEFEDMFEYPKEGHRYKVRLQLCIDGEEVEVEDPLANYKYPPDLSPYK